MAKQSPHKSDSRAAEAPAAKPSSKPLASDGVAPTRKLFKDRNGFLLGALLFVVAAWAFLPAIHNGFINFDDQVYVYQNAHVQDGVNWQSIRWAFTNLDAGFWHPLTWLSILLDVQFYGMRPGGHHLTSLLLHAANAALVFSLLLRMTGARWRSAFVALLFALHPLHVEAVAWAADRKDILCTFFWMLTLLMYARYAAGAKFRRPERKVSYVLGLLFFLCALMSKTMAVTLPVLLLLLDWWPLRRFELDPRASKSRTVLLLLAEKLPFFAASLVAGLLTMRAEKGLQALPSTVAYPVSDRLANAALSYLRYLFQTFWPADLAVYYPYPDGFSPWAVIASVVALICISALAARAFRRRPYLVFGWVWYVVTLLPVIGLVQVGSHSHADRYTYVPLIGIFIVLTWGTFEFTQRWLRRPQILAAAALALLLLCFGLTRRQLAFWKDSETLLRHTIAVTKDNEPMHNNLGNVYAQQGRLEEAITEFQEAVTLNPNGAGVRDNLGAALARQGRLDEAIEQLHEAIRLDPRCADAYNNLGAAFGRQGRLDEAIEQLQTALKLTPNDAGARCNLADALAVKGRFDEAITQYQESLRLKPDDADARRNLQAALEAKAARETPAPAPGRSR
jgi:tetratricopeptide (TPR) repeat protein